MTDLYDVNNNVIAQNIPNRSFCVGDPIWHGGKQYVTLQIQGMGDFRVFVMPWDDARMLLLDSENGKEIALAPLVDRRLVYGESIEHGGVEYAIENTGSFGLRERNIVRVLYVRKAAA